MEEKEIEQHYKSLKFVEEAFRQLKQLIEIRPIFHWKERRVRTHIFLCIIAQTIVNKIVDVLTVNGWLQEEKEKNFLISWTHYTRLMLALWYSSFSYFSFLHSF